MEQKTKYNEYNLAGALAYLYNGYLTDGTLPGANEEMNLQLCADILELSAYQTLVLAYMFHYHPTEIAEFKLVSLADGFDENAEEELDELCTRQILSKRKIRDDATFCYRMEESAYNSLMSNGTVGRKTISDCLKMLSGGEPDKVRSASWRESFYEAADKSSDRQIGDAISELKIKECSSDVQDAFWVLVWQFVNHFITPFAFRGVSTALKKGSNETKLKTAMGTLVSMGLAESLPIEMMDHTDETEHYILALTPAELMFRGQDKLARYDVISKVVNVIHAKDIEKKDLSFSDNTQRDVDALRTMVSKEGYNRVAKILKDKHRKPGIQFLLWGPPGTGKTEIIKQIARETGRDLLLLDVAKTMNSFWGATEKCYSTLFRAYSYIVAIVENQPILVMNEADNVLSRRLTNVNTPTARSENAISNIILQGFEDMSGILFATTNLVTNLDEAFDRRFLFKIEMTQPSPEARVKIWRASVPELSDSQARELAYMFDMTGAQISNVVAKRDLAELYYDGDRGMEYIVGLCRTEVQEPVKNHRRAVGY